MAHINEQVHHKFKVFAGKLAEDGTLGALAGEVEGWASGGKLAPKSIGIEYVEAADKLILSIGYRDDEAGYPIQLHSAKLGKLGSLDAADRARIERAMAEASARLEHVICHELYVTDENELLMVFMSHRA